MDYNATAPPDARILAALSEAAHDVWANPSSQHSEGRAARQAVERARRQVAALLSPTLDPSQIVFTSGGTEGNNTILRGALLTAGGSAPQIITSPLEHPSVLAPLAQTAARVSYLPIDERGRWCLEDLERLLRTGTGLCSLALVNHEIGNVYPIAAAARLAHQHGWRFHCDAVQAVGRIPLDVRALDVDALTLSGHKFQGPKGIGALYLSSTWAQAQPLLQGGAQEKGRRAGTENVAAIVALGQAAALAQADLAPRAARIGALRDRLEQRLLRLPGARVHGDSDAGARAPGTSNLAFAGVEGEVLMMSLDLRGAAVSTGAACSSGSAEPSAVVQALQRSAGAEVRPARARAAEAVRFSLGPGNDEAQVDQVAAWVEDIVAHVRSL